MTPADGVRIRVNATTIGLIVALVMNGGGLIWGAAKLSSAVESVQSTVSKLDGTLSAVGQSVQNLRERVGVLEDRGNRTQADAPHRPIP